MDSSDVQVFTAFALDKVDLDRSEVQMPVRSKPKVFSFLIGIPVYSLSSVLREQLLRLDGRV